MFRIYKKVSIKWSFFYIIHKVLFGNNMDFAFDSNIILIKTV